MTVKYFDFMRFYMIILLLITIESKSQISQVTGSIVDAVTLQPVAFASIKVKENQKGALTDIDGNFKFSNVTLPCHLIISHIGYSQKEVKINTISDLISISLYRKNELLKEVTVSSNLNPAHRIIQLMQKYKQKNNPLQLPSFSYNAYTISVIGVGPRLFTWAKENAKKQKEKPIKSLRPLKTMNKTDSIILQSEKAFSASIIKNYLFLSESYTERDFLYPQKSKETVLATKMSGMNNPLFAVSEDDLNQFGFYSDYFNIINKTYTSPIINGSINLYKFTLREVIQRDKDTTWVISYLPRKSKNFNGLSGVLYINSNNYAIENVIASPADEKTMFLTFRLQQKYENVNGHWFPKQINTYIAQKDIVKDSVLVYIDKRIYLSNIDFNKKFKNSDFTDITRELTINAGKHSEEEWEKFRTDSIGTKEKATYKAYDSLPPKTKIILNGFNKYSEIFALQAITWGKFDIPFKSIITGINSYEKLRLGFGVQSNPLLSKNISIGAYAGYGFRDKAYKYGGNLSFKLDKKNQNEIMLSFKQDLTEPGTTPYFAENSTLYSNFTIRNFYGYRFDSIRHYKVQLNTKLNPKLKSTIWLFNENRKTAKYAYEFSINGDHLFKNNFINTEAGFGLRYATRESYQKIGRAIVLQNQPKSLILFQIGHGFKNIFGGELDYTKAALQINHSFNIKFLGNTNIRIEAGKIWGNIPYGYMFNTRGIIRENGSETNFYVRNSFQTVGVYEFNATQSASLFLKHNFGNLLFKPKNTKFRPEFILIQNIGYGSINNQSSHFGLTLNAPEKGIFESGLLIDNIFRLKTPFCYMGGSFGYFRRYGYYTLPIDSKNGTFNFGITLTR